MRGSLSNGAWWRQDVETVEVVVEMPDDASFKRDVDVEISRKKLSLNLKGATVLEGELSHDVVAADSDWFVEDDLEGFGDADRYLVVSLKKKESYVNWASVLAPITDPGATPGPKRLAIGGKGDAQKLATVQQLASYQIFQKLPTAVRGDVYARVPPAADGTPSTTLYFVGKVIAETAQPSASLASQELLVKEHVSRPAYSYTPTVH